MYNNFIKRSFKDIDKVSFEINVTWNLCFTGNIKVNVKVKTSISLRMSGGKLWS